MLLAVQDSSIGDLVNLFVREWVTFFISASSEHNDYNNYNDCNDKNDYIDWRDRDLDLDWERLSE